MSDPTMIQRLLAEAKIDGLRSLIAAAQKEISELEANLGFTPGTAVAETAPAPATSTARTLSPDHRSRISKSQQDRWRTRKQPQPVDDTPAPEGAETLSSVFASLGK